MRGRKGEWENGRKGEWEKGRKGEREKGRKGEWEKGRGVQCLVLIVKSSASFQAGNFFRKASSSVKDISAVVTPS